jgi:hypothetical protein
MKNLKQKIKNACLALSMLLLCNSIYAQVMVTSGQNYKQCQGQSLYYEVTPTSNYYVPDEPSWQWGSSSNTCNTTSCTFNGYTVNNWMQNTACGNNNVIEVEVTCNSTLPIAVTVLQYECGYNTLGTNITFTITPYTTTVTGTADFCHTSNETYTCVTNESVGTNAYTWSTGTGGSGTPSFLSGTSTTNTDATTTIGSGTGNISVTVSGSGSCPTGSASNTGALALTSHSGAPVQPSGGLTMRQTGNSCQFDAHISAVTGATSYIWSLSPTMSPTILSNGITTYPYGDFDYSTTYDVYVEASNSCGTSAANHWNPTTPGKPAGCQMSPIKPGEPIEGYKVYPNPANNQVTIEYPANNSGSDMTLLLYDMVGHKIANWILPSSETKINENTSALPTGMYMYIINSGDNVVMKGKVLIQR